MNENLAMDGPKDLDPNLAQDLAQDLAQTPDQPLTSGATPTLAPDIHRDITPDISPDIVRRLNLLEARVETLMQQRVADRITQLEEALTLVTDVERYQPLQRLLKAGNLLAADHETLHVLLLESGTPNREDLTPDEVKQLPCSVLRVVDRLWTTYTDGRFGFSVQLRQYQAVGGTLDSALTQDLPTLRRLGDAMGWRANGQWKTIDQAPHQLSDPVGCYPVLWWDSPYGAKMVNYFLVRLFTCHL